MGGRRLLAALAALSLCAGSGAATAAPIRFVIDGRGWGHGLGMSQWGAAGFAEHGWGYRRILAHYYPQTSLERRPTTRVRVLLVEGRPSVVVSSRSSFRVAGARGRTYTVHGGRYRIGPRLRIRVGGKRLALRLPLRFDPGATPLALDGDAYRGSLAVRGGAGSFSVVNSVLLERYLRGVVPSEMPHRWNSEALKAQAVAARSYALAELTPGRGYDLLPDTRDQVYGGIRAERDSTNIAVGATSGEVLMWDGRPAVTYYCSTSGGRTEAISDVWPTARQVPYLVSVPDPYDAASPHHRWGPLVFTARVLAKRLEVPAVRTLTTVIDSSGRVASVTARWRGGSSRISGRSLASALELPSTWFRVRGGRGVAGGSAAPAVSPSNRPQSEGAWPPGRSGYTLVLDSIPTSAGLAAARSAARQARDDGVPQVGVFDSSEFSSLRAAYWVVFSGRYATADAAKAAARALPPHYRPAYVRRVQP